MQYREFTKDNIKLSALGFGVMRLPVINNDESQIDEDKSIKMIRHAIDQGVNYIDTAYAYHGGNSEAFVSKALEDGYRDKVYIATKLPSWLVKTREDMNKFLNEQLDRLKVECIDFYLLHTLNKRFWDNLKNLGVIEFLEEAKKAGKIKYIGFSFHDEYEVFEEIIDYYNWDFCQIQLNYMDENIQAGLKGLKYAYEKDISVIIMEPIKGGKLVNPSNEIQAVWDQNDRKMTPAQWALEWVLNHKEVGILLSGMSNMDQVKENIETVSKAEIAGLSEKELELIARVTSIYEDKVQVGCTSCGYCIPCPQGVAIPDIFQAYNDLYVYEDLETPKKTYKSYIKDKVDASRCIECGICEENCPQNIDIIEDLIKAKKELES